MKNRFSHIGIAIIILIISIISAKDFSRVDDIPYHAALQKDILTVDDMRDTDSAFDSISDGTLQVSEGEGIKQFYSEVSLTEGDSFQVSFTVNNKTADAVDLCVDLSADGFDDAYNEAQVTVQPGITNITCELPFYREEHPEKCLLRIFTSGSDLVITDLRVDRIQELRDGHRLVKIAVAFMYLLAAVSSLYILIGLIFRQKDGVTRREKKPDLKREILLYIVIITAVTLLLMFLYRNADLHLPLIYMGSDDIGVYYFGKSIPEYGLLNACQFSICRGVA